MQAASHSSRPALNIGVEALRACPGACTGCMVPDHARDGGLPSERTMSLMAEAGRLLVEAYLAIAPLQGPDEASVQFLQGDYLHLQPDDLRRAIRLAHEIANGQVRALFSTSLVSKTADLERRLDVMMEEAGRLGQEVAVTPIFNPLWMADERLRRLYERNVETVRRYMPLDEAGFNIGPGLVGSVTPETVDGFFSECGFSDVDIALLPLRSNAAAFSAEWAGIVSWLRSFFSLSRLHRRYEAIFPALAAEHMRHTDGIDFGTILTATAGKLAWEVFLDHDGHASALQTGGFANVVPFSDRFGFNPLMDLSVAPFTPQIWRKAASRTARLIHAPALLDPVCADCSWRTTCALAGSAIIRSSMHGHDIATPQCPLGIDGLFADASADTQAGRGGRNLFGTVGS